MSNVARTSPTRLTGFSLAELLVVIAILGMLAGITAARLSGPGEKTLINTETRKLITHLRASRSRSLAESRFYHFEEMDDGQGYLIRPDGDPVKLPEPLKLSLGSGSHHGDQSTVGASIVFYPDGRTTGGSISLETINHKQTITVDWITGEVTLGNPEGNDNASGS